MTLYLPDMGKSARAGSARRVPRSGLFREANGRLDYDLDGWLRNRRAAGLSWQAISRELHSSYGLTVTDMTLVNWARALGIETKKAS